MNPVKSLTITILSVFLVSCNGDNSKKPSGFSIQIMDAKKDFFVDDTINIQIKTPESFVVDSIVYSINNKKTPKLNKNTIVLKDVKLGTQNIEATVHHNGKTDLLTKKITILSNIKPELYTYEIIKEYPHDIKAYTQGLEFYNDTLYESTGKYGKSSLRKVNYTTGAVVERIDLDNNYFGEGITILNNKIIQLTWQKRIGFVYNLNSFKKTGSFMYKNSKEGWGLCNDGDVIYKSDGTEKIWLLDPETYAEKDFFQIVSNKKIYNKVNEMEYVDGSIYANSYQNDGIMIIDANNGALLGVVDCRGLKKKVTQHSELDVLNGIAYHPIRKTFFLTGKNWDKMFEVRFIEK
ncbi:glutaminyl-peptide cyclotransferase [Leptobacterium sp. I13]|uniref:glutaminyl-peptide cyclotransferase n=1 Tax=Leptobacterium meishanense TaxID=3128904 RepID=UPI0030EB940A